MNNAIIVGSMAADYWGISRREPNDIDVWARERASDITYTQYADVKIVPDALYAIIPQENGYITADGLYTLKCSHLAWDIHWQKTKLDIIFMSSQCKVIPELFCALKTHWGTIHGNKDFLSLNKNKTDFFTDAVYSEYDHDYLHELVAFPDDPVYKRCLVKGRDVMIDRTKFESMSFDDKVLLFREEITVIACERWILNDKNEINDWYTSYKLALKKTICSLTKNWATNFIIFNLKEFIIPNYEQFKHILHELEKDMSIDKTELENLAEKLHLSDLDDFVVSLASDELLDSIDISDFVDNVPDWAIDHGTAYREVSAAVVNKCQEILDKCGYEFIESEGGGEGGAEDCTGVFKLKNKVYRACWSYYSYSGVESVAAFSTLQEVKPVERLVTFYE